MNCESGNIYTPEMMAFFKKKWGKAEEETGVPHPDREKFIPMEVEPTEKQLARTPQRVGRNEPCPCGSGLKFKKCHLILNYRSTDKRLVK
jgi:uncharacterized protein YecA (UPF0149 family)